MRQNFDFARFIAEMRACCRRDTLNDPINGPIVLIQQRVHEEDLAGCCQTKTRSLRLSEFGCSSGRTYLPPLIQNSSAVRLEIVPAVEMAFLIEVVVDGGAD
jgi:hypothetical protein